ncbi:ThuA domain-containing protein [Salipiger sp. IMCC34102]|uniref:ThuA domain-containing protein n=1 Tax=Salipiger sp. IMCC34102 TaxID=2510647 RepID=UPI00101BDE21|nr:ThuA domain-containing protein [Salipiger sp. IMCC34102]RYH04453.1 ThuA domain-containing protein [Salipiger sp. IMCC34102]
MTRTAIFAAVAGFGAMALGTGALAQQQTGGLPDSYTTFEKYGVCGSIDDTCYNDWNERSEGDEDGWNVLIYYYVAPGVGPHDNLNAGVSVLETLFEEEGYTVTTSNDPATFESSRNIRDMDAVVFFSTGREALTDLGRHQLMLYIRGGGGFAGIHNAFGTSYSWTWYEGLLGGQLFNHGPRQEAEVVVQQPNDPSVAHLGEGTTFDQEEFYNIYPDPRRLSDVNILLTVDESTMLEGQSDSHPGMGEGHPVSWCHYYDGGRAWVTTLGHSVAVLVNDDWRQHVLGGVKGVMGAGEFCVTE